MNRIKRPDSFELQNDPSSHEQVQTLAGDLDAPVRDKDVLLSLDEQVCGRELVDHCLFVNRLQKSASQSPMDLDGRTDYPVGQLFVAFSYRFPLHFFPLRSLWFSSSH